MQLARRIRCARRVLLLLGFAISLGRAEAQRPDPLEPASQEAPAARDAAPPAEVDCITCAGSGRVVEACWVCRGEGKHPCAACTRFAAKPWPRWRGGWKPAAVTRLIMEGLVLPELELPGLNLGGRKKSPAATKLKPGDVACPARCRGGKLLHIERWVDCKLCRGGKFDCGFCKGGVVKCRACGGSGEVVGACDDCAGRGRLPAAPEPWPAPGAKLDCPWCGGSLVRACGTCDDEGRVQLACQECYGELEPACELCHGLAVIPCPQCGGRGRYGRDKRNCAECDQEGKLTCPACDDGVIVCATCGGRDAPPVPCTDCGGKREHRCNGCEELSYLAWEYEAAACVARGEHGHAAVWLRQAMKRCELRYSKALDSLGHVEDAELSKKLLRAVEEEEAGELRRLGRLLKKAEREAEAGV